MDVMTEFVRAVEASDFGTPTQRAQVITSVSEAESLAEAFRELPHARMLERGLDERPVSRERAFIERNMV